MPELTIPRGLNGPADSANGGIVSGRLAAFLDTQGPVTVTLRLPPPLDTPMPVEPSERGMTLFHNGDLVAVAERSDLVIEPVPAVSWGRAVEASERFDGFTDHPFPTCFGCGTERPDGLLCHAGAVDPADTSYVATTFVRRAEHPSDLSLTWAALDCAGGWSIGLVGRRAVLGRMTAHIVEVPEVGEQCVVVAQCDRWDGRKAYSRSTGYGRDGRVLGVTTATWIELK